MNKVVKKLSTGVATVAKEITSGSVNSVCWFLLYQPELPEGAKRLRKK